MHGVVGWIGDRGTPATALRSVVAAFPALSLPGRNLPSGGAIMAALGAGGRVSVATQGELLLACDGALSNRDELLATLGLVAENPSTAELLLAAWRRWGRAMSARLEGAFAFALADTAAGSIFCARDPLGQVPFHYAQVAGAFAFGSSLPALVTWRGLRRRANPDALAHLLAFGHLPPAATAFEGIACLEPGCLLEFTAPDPATPQPYWSLPPVAEPKRKPPAGAIGPRSPLRKALAQRLRQACDTAAAPDALLLLGTHAGPWLAEAAPQSQQLRPSFHGTEAVTLHQGELQLGPATLAATTAWLWQTGEPSADPLGAIRHAILAAPALSGQVVALDAGGDELLLAQPGYAQFADMLEQLRNNPGAFRSNGFHGGTVMARDLVQLVSGCFNEVDRLELCGPALMHTFAFAVADELGTGLEEVAPANAADALFRLDWARRVAAREASAAWQASQGRPAPVVAPFIDRAVVEWCAGQPQAIRQRLAAPAGPIEDLPIDRWLRGPLRSFTRDTLSSSAFRARGLYNLAYVDRLVEQCIDHGEATGRLIWPLLCLELWFKTFIDRVPTKALPPLALDRHASIVGAA